MLVYRYSGESKHVIIQQKYTNWGYPPISFNKGSSIRQKQLRKYVLERGPEICRAEPQRWTDCVTNTRLP